MVLPEARTYQTNAAVSQGCRYRGQVAVQPGYTNLRVDTARSIHETQS